MISVKLEDGLMNGLENVVKRHFSARRLVPTGDEARVQK